MTDSNKRKPTKEAHKPASVSGLRLAESKPEELSMRLAGPLLHYVGVTYGTDAVDKLARSLGRNVDDLKSGQGWLSHEDFEKLLAESRALMKDDDEFRRAFKYQLRQSWGPMGYLVRAASVGNVLTFAVKTMHHVSKISRYTVLDSDRRSIRCHYRSDKNESRLMCLSRQASIEAMPTAWGLPAAQLEESACIAHGDDHCAYQVRWHEQPRWLPVLTGAAIAGALGWLLHSQIDVARYFVVTLAALGGVIGYAAELWRTQIANTRFSQETNESLREMARQTVEAMEESQALAQRQDEWSRILEEQVTERTQALQEVLDRVQKLDERRHTSLRVVSHDLKNPMATVRAALDLLKEDDLPQADRQLLLQDASEDIRRVERLVTDLAVVAESGSQAALLELVATVVAVPKLAERLRRGLRAMVWGQSIRTSVFCTPEAPADFETDVVLFDRVVDNLLQNAAKVTERGSILVELAGSPGMITLKVSDTGPGISNERIEKVFRVGESSFVESGRGWGLGLPIVVRLLDQIGGRLEVLSQPGKGTTFWAHFPTSLPEPRRPQSEPPMEEAIDRVVTIRRTI